MKYAVITGASRGLGASAAQRLMAEGIHVISVSRTENIDLKQTAAETESGYLHYN